MPVTVRKQAPDSTGACPPRQLGELVELRRMIPICASCHRIRNDENYWQTVEGYFTRHLGVDFTHGLCPECVERLYPEFKG